MGTFWCSRGACRSRTARRASCSPSMRSPTGRSRASAFGAAISCSRRIPRLAAPGSSASGRSGAAIFETTGAWEDFATPSRDLRLLIALDVVRGFPDRVARRPERYAMPKEKSVAEVKAELESVLASELAARKFSYPRSDGSAWTLALKDVVDRAAALEMAYNLNDCVELRWGAPDKSDEASTCKRRAPSPQRAKMTEYRAWFRERRRPPRA